MKTGLKLGVLALAGVIGAIGVAGAQEKSRTLIFGGNPHWLSVNRGSAARVVLDDQVSDGCWKNPGSSKTVVEVELVRSGFSVSDDKGVLVVIVQAVGYKTSSCVSLYKMKVSKNLVINSYYSAGHNITYIREEPLWEAAGVMSGGADLSDRLKNAFGEMAQQFLVESSKERATILQKVREAADQPEAKAYWSSYKLD